MIYSPQSLNLLSVVLFLEKSTYYHNFTALSMRKSYKNITAEFLSLNLPNLGIMVRFDNVENATMKTGEAAYIFYLSVANNGLKQMRVEIPFAHYVNLQGEEIEQSGWLSGLLLGTEGATIRAGAFRKMGLVFYKDCLPRIAIGHHLYVSVLPAKPALRLNFTFRCTDNKLHQFTLIHAAAEDIQALDENGEVSSEKVELLQRMTRLEESMQDILRRLDAITTLPVPVNKPICPPIEQTLPDILTWMCSQSMVTMADLRLKLLPLDLLPSAVIDDINEKSYDLQGDAALQEDGDVVMVQQEALLQVLATWQES